MGRPDDSLTEAVIGACIEVHRCLGPGLQFQRLLLARGHTPHCHQVGNLPSSKTSLLSLIRFSLLVKKLFKKGC